MGAEAYLRPDDRALSAVLVTSCTILPIMACALPPSKLLVTPARARTDDAVVPVPAKPTEAEGRLRRGAKRRAAI